MGSVQHVTGEPRRAAFKPCAGPSLPLHGKEALSDGGVAVSHVEETGYDGGGLEANKGGRARRRRGVSWGYSWTQTTVPRGAQP